MNWSGFVCFLSALELQIVVNYFLLEFSLTAEFSVVWQSRMDCLQFISQTIHFSLVFFLKILPLKSTANVQRQVFVYFYDYFGMKQLIGNKNLTKRHNFRFIFSSSVIIITLYKKIIFCCPRWNDLLFASFLSELLLLGL